MSESTFAAVVEEDDFWQMCELSFGGRKQGRNGCGTGESSSGDLADAKDREPLWVALRIYNLTQLDLVAQTIYARMRIYMTWQLNPEELETLDELGRSSAYARAAVPTQCDSDAFAALQKPRLAMYSAQSLEEGERVFYVLDWNKGLVMATWQARVTWSVRINFKRLPVDTQEVPLTFNLNYRDDAARWRLQVVACDFHSYCMHFQGGAWRLTPPRAIQTVTRSVIVSFYLQRRPLYYLIKIDFVIGLLTGLSFLAHSNRLEEFSDRTELLMTIILALVVYLYVVQDGLPKASYLTFLDEHCYACLIFLCVQLMWIACLDPQDEEWGAITLYISAGTFVAYHATWLLRMLYFATTGINAIPPMADTGDREWKAFRIGDANFSDIAAGLQRMTPPPTRET